MNNEDVRTQRQLHKNGLTNGLTEAEQLHGSTPQSKLGQGRAGTKQRGLAPVSGVCQ